MQIYWIAILVCVCGGIGGLVNALLAGDCTYLIVKGTYMHLDGLET